MTTGRDEFNRHFKGWPKTELDGKNQIIRIRARYISPRMWRLRNILFLFGVIGAIVFGIWKHADIQPLIEGIEGWYLIGGVIVSLIVFYFILYRVCQAKALIEFTPELIRIKKHARIRFTEYERGLPHNFDAELHEKAKDEEKADMALRSREGKEGEMLYRKTYQVYMDHVDGRIYIADVIEKKKAKMFLSRLEGVNEFMDTFLVRAHAHQVKSQFDNKKGPQSHDAPVDDDRPGY